jgi:hypothetical protein
MAISSYPFEDQTTTESQYSQLFRRLQSSGVAGAPGTTDLRVFADSTGMQVKVPAGYAIVRGHAFDSTAEETLSISSATSNPRIDLVILRLDPAADEITLEVITGTPATTPSAPALEQTAEAVFEMAIARVNVPASATTIAPANVTDIRPFIGTQFGRWTTATRPSNPVVGTAGLNTTISAPEYWSGSAWVGFLGDGAVTTAKIADGAVTTPKLENSAVTEIKINNNAVSAVKIADNAITTSKILNSAVTDAKISTSAVVESKIADNAVTTAKVIDGAISASKISDAAIETAKIADNAVTDAKISAVSATKLSGAADSLTRVKASSTTGVSLTSTGNALTLGNPAATNLALDGDEIQARNGTAASLISINRLGGNVDIGTTTRGLGIDGSLVWANGVYDNVLSTSFRSVFVSNTDTRNKLGYVPSSRTLKKNIQPLRYTAEQILSIQPVEFHYKTQNNQDAKNAGFIAEDLHEAGLTAFVSYDENGKPAAVHYEFFAVALQQLVRDQAMRLDAIESRLSKLEK